MSQNKYELAVILDPSVDDRQVAPTLEKFLAVVPKEGGTVDNVDIWGRRQFAYPIKKKTEGVYAFVQITSTPDTINEVDRLLRLSDSVLRTKVLRAEDAHVVLRQPRKAS
ncbi:30S ribosomal protein S6 [Pseudoclavibacter soli]|jgi:small subunit ribosomal protein S6|uniref:30S ribosomal protein S6 n=1 Tax=Pseudoclavibacter soli TaxID=452623 RepID=UPI00042486F5|nr:30S ribosomal protein S6 [Pseudoclavibacter soli]